MLRVPSTVAWLAVAATLASASAAHAQFNNQYNAQAMAKARLMQLPVVDLKGTVDQVGADGLTMKCEGQSFVLAMDPAHSRVICNGTAERSYLKPGVMVKFEGEFDRKMQLKGGPLEALSVVSPSDTAQPGIHSDSATDENGDEEKRPVKRGANESCVVIGTIKLFKDDQLQVVADGKPIKTQLAEDAEIKVEVDDFTLASAGDEIVVRGRTIQPPQGPQAGQVFGEEVTITLSQPLETKTVSKKKKSSKSSKTAKRAS